MLSLLLPLGLFLLFGECQGRANVTLQLGLSYDGSPDCDDTVYKVTVCVGERIEKCRLFGPFDFYIQAACASHGPKETIEFVVEHVDEPLRINAKVKRTNTDTIYELRSAEAVLTQSREISMASQDLLFVLRFRVSYTCVANYFGELCDVYCDAQAKEYTCTSLGEKICNAGYVKDPASGTCVYDRCRSMPDYCLNDGECVNPAQYTDTTAPICICPEGRDGPRCEYETTSPPQLPPLKLPVPPQPAASTQPRGAVDLPELKVKAEETSGSGLSSSPGNDRLVGNSGVSGDEDDNGGASKTGAKGEEVRETYDFAGRRQQVVTGPEIQASRRLEEYPVSGHIMTDRSLWYQVIVFTSVAVCLTVVAFAACLAASCYVFRFKAKAQLLRSQQHNASIGELQFVDSGNMPVYLKRCSSMDCAGNHGQHQNPSVHSFAAVNRPLVQGSPTLCLEDDPEMIFSNTQSRSPPLMNGQTLPPAAASGAYQWPPLSLIGSLKRPLKSPHWGDYGNSVPLYERNSRTLQRGETPSGAMELSLHASAVDPLPTISPEVYSCRNAYQYLSPPEFNNHLVACPSDAVRPAAAAATSTLNNRLSMRRESSSRRRLTMLGRTGGYEVLSQSLGDHPRSPTEPDCTELTKNDFRDTCGLEDRGRSVDGADEADAGLATVTPNTGLFSRVQTSNVSMPFEPPSPFADVTLQTSN